MEIAATIALMAMIALGAVRAVRADPYFTRRRVIAQVLVIAAHIGLAIAVSVVAARTAVGKSGGTAAVIVVALLAYIVASTVFVAWVLKPRRAS